MTHFDNIERRRGKLRGKTVLDIGFGAGDFVLQAARHGARVFGAEIRAARCKALQERLSRSGLTAELHCGDIMQAPFADASFDLINVCEVLEHVEDPAALLRRISSLLKADGSAYVSVHNRFGLRDAHFKLRFINWMPRRLAARIISVLGRDKDYAHSEDRQSIADLHYFTFRAFRELARAAGLNVTDVRLERIERLPWPVRMLAWPAYVLLLRPLYFNTFHCYLDRHVRITYITNVRLPTEKAHGLQIMKNCEALSKGGAELVLIAPDLPTPIGTDPFAYYGVEPVFKLVKSFVIRLPRSGRIWAYLQGLSFSIPAVLSVMFRRNRVFYSRDYITLFLLAVAGRRPIAEIHDYRLARRSAVLASMFRRCCRVVVNSAGTLAAIRKHYHLPDSRVLIAPNGVDPGFFRVESDRQAVRGRLGLPVDKFVIGYTGRLEFAGAEKGVGILIEAVAELAKRGRDCLLCVVGGPDELVQAYRKRAAAAMPESFFCFVGQVEYKKVPLYLRAMDVVVIPLGDTPHSRTTSPIKMFEYLAAGKAIVAADWPGLRPFLHEGNALFFRPEDKIDLADRLQGLIQDPTLLGKLAESAGSDAARYTWTARAERIIASVNSCA